MNRSFANSAARACPPAPQCVTRRVVLAAAMMAAGAIPSVVLAQSNPTPAPNNPPRPATTEGRAQAPVGHRQPRPQDLPPDVQRDENGAGRSPAERGLDQKLQICRDC